MAALYLLERQRGVALLGGSIGMLLLLNLGITFVLPGISIGGHIGGIVGGAAAALRPVGLRPRAPRLRAGRRPRAGRPSARSSSARSSWACLIA